MKAAIKVGDLVKITLPEGHAGFDQKGLWLVVALHHSSSRSSSFIVLKGTQKLILSALDLQKVSE